MIVFRNIFFKKKKNANFSLSIVSRISTHQSKNYRVKEGKGNGIFCSHFVHWGFTTLLFVPDFFSNLVFLIFLFIYFVLFCFIIDV